MNRHCEWCSRVLVVRNRIPQKRFCSRACSLANIRENKLNQTLSDEQIAKIIAMRVDQLSSKPRVRSQYKLIARAVGCSPEQARHYWFMHKSRGSELFHTQMYRLRNAAKTALAAEIAAAKAEKATAAPYKVGLLGEW